MVFVCLRWAWLMMPPIGRVAAARVRRARRGPWRLRPGGEPRAAPFFGGRAGRGHGDLDAAAGDADQRADLQELKPDGAAGGVRKGGFCKADAPQGASSPRLLAWCDPMVFLCSPRVQSPPSTPGSARSEGPLRRSLVSCWHNRARARQPLRQLVRVRMIRRQPKRDRSQVG